MATTTQTCDDPTAAMISALAKRDEELLNEIEKLKAMVYQQAVVPGVYAFVSDQGKCGTAQTNLVGRTRTWGPNGVFFGGDNNMDFGLPDTIDENWEEWNDTYGGCTEFYPAMGAHDLSTNAGQPQMDYFTSLYDSDGDDIADRRYFDVELDRGSIHLFVLDSGLDINRTLQEPDGITVGSTQYRWFLDRLAASTSRWKIVMFAHPFVTSLHPAHSKRHVSRMDWGFESLGIHLVLNGHIHGNEHIRKQGMDILNVSGAGISPMRNLHATDLRGESEHCSLVWNDRAVGGSKGLPSVARITANEQSLKAEVIRVSDGSIAHTLTV